MTEGTLNVIGLLVTFVIGPLVTAFCTWILKRGQKKSDNTTVEVAKELSQKTEQIAEKVSTKNEEHKDIMVKEAKAAFNEANDLNAKMLKILERMEVLEKYLPKRKPD